MGHLTRTLLPGCGNGFRSWWGVLTPHEPDRPSGAQIGGLMRLQLSTWRRHFPAVGRRVMRGGRPFCCGTTWAARPTFPHWEQRDSHGRLRDGTMIDPDGSAERPDLGDVTEHSWNMQIIGTFTEPLLIIAQATAYAERLCGSMCQAGSPSNRISPLK